MVNDLGHRYRCEECGIVVLCIRRGEGEVQCCAAPMVLLPPRELPSAD